MNVFVVSCYELGHQPLALASAVAFLERAGFETTTLDLSVETLDDGLQRIADRAPGLIAVSVPMHTALRVASDTIPRLHRAAPGAHVSYFGLYATLNSGFLLGGSADSILGGETEESLVHLAQALASGAVLESVPGLHLPGRSALPVLRRLDFPVPRRDTLPAQDRYAALEIDGETRRAAAIETSRGCLHLCRHCPIPAVYEGRFFVVPSDVVLSDVRQLVDRGVRHLTFADPDFFNGPGHSMRVVRAIHSEFPEVTFDVTTKVEHLIRHARHLTELERCGCVFIVSAVESLSDTVLQHLHKGHTRDDIDEALRLVDEAGIPLRPSLLPFTPWAGLEDYLELIEWVEQRDLIDNIDPVQYSIRLLVPPGSALEKLDAMRPHLRGLQPERLSHAWEHPDPRMDRLHGQVSQIVRQAAGGGEPTPTTLRRISDTAWEAAGRAEPPRPIPPRLDRVGAPRLTEPWFC